MLYKKLNYLFEHKIHYKNIIYNMNNIKNFVFNLFLPLLLAILVAFATKNDYSNVELLNRNIIFHPIIFIIIWSILYVLMGLFSYFCEKENNNLNICIYWISLLCNLLFSFILFSFKNNVLAFIDIIILLIIIIYLFINSLLIKKDMDIYFYHIFYGCCALLL